MPNETFRSRIQTLHDAWEERRETTRYSGLHDFASQLTVLQAIHRWTADALADVRAVYGDLLRVEFTPNEPPTARDPAFSFTLAQEFGANASLIETPRAQGRSWQVRVSVFSPQRRGAISTIGPERRRGQWSHGRIQELVLSVLSAYERSRGMDDEAAPPPRGRGAISAQELFPSLRARE